VEKFKSFEDWLKASHQVNWRENMISINLIDNILAVPGLEKITSVSILNQLLDALRKNASFAGRAKTERDKEIKTFKLYIQFAEARKAAKDSKVEADDSTAE
jgi:hypothetical protein